MAVGWETAAVAGWAEVEPAEAAAGWVVMEVEGLVVEVAEVAAAVEVKVGSPTGVALQLSSLRCQAPWAC